MKIAVIISFVCCWLVCCWLGSSSAWAIDCLGAPGDPKTGWYAWREIEGRRCWFKKAGAMPPKSQLHWTSNVQQEPRSIEPVAPSKERTVRVPAPPPEPDATNRPESGSPTPPFKMVRVKPAAAASLRLGNGQVDLMNGASLSAMPALAGGRRPARLGPADPFNARFTGSRD
jgi:hypothetical protein